MKSFTILVGIGALILTLLSFDTTFATPTITSVDVTDIACKSDGKLVVHATGNGTLYYALIAPSQVTRVTQTSNVFDNLPAGSYTVAVYDADQPNTPVTVVKTIYGVYTPLVIASANASTFVPAGESEYCVYTGRVTVKISGGKAPYTYELLNSGGAVIATEISAAALKNFDELPTGNYSVRIKDCGSVITTGTIAAISSTAPLKDVAFNTVSGTISTSSGARASCTDLTITLSAITVNGNSLAAYPGVRYRIVYDNVASDWQTVSTNALVRFPPLVATNFAITKPQNIYIEVEHPCSKIVKRSSAITFSITQAFVAMLYGDVLFNPCTRVSDSVRFQIGNETGDKYYCEPYTANVTIAGKTYTFSETSPYFPINTSYTLNSVIDGAGNDITASVYKASKTYTYTQPDSRVHQITLPSKTFLPNGCDFNGGQVVFKPGFYIPPTSILTSNNLGQSSNIQWVDTIPSYIQKTKYTIKLTNGPAGSNYASKAEVVINIAKNTAILAQTEYPLWNDLIDGTYTAEIKIESENGSPCTITRTFTMQRALTAFTVTTPVLAGSCGAYTISGKAYYTKGNNTTDTQTPYSLNIYKSDNSLLGTVSATSNSNAVYSDINLVGGTYTVKYLMGNCETGSYSITVPHYTPLDVNITLSGGISCPPGNTADLIVSMVAGSGVGTIQYRIKEQGQPDSYFSAWQTSNKFTNKAKGIYYTIEIKDDCGSIQRDILVQDGAQQFLTVIGPVAPGIVCKDLSVTFGAYSIGEIISYQWFKDGIAIPGATSIDYTLALANSSTPGTYTVEVITGGGCKLSNSYTITTVSEPTPSPTIIGTNKVCASGNTLTLEASSSVTSGTYQWYKNGVLVNASISKYYTITVTQTATYTVLVIPTGGCASAQSAPFTVSIGTPDAPTLTGNNTVCFGHTTTFTASPALSDVTYEWYRNGTLFNQTSNNIINASVSQGEIYTVKISPHSGCSSSASNAITMSVYNNLVAGTVNSSQTICQGTAPTPLTQTPTSGGSGNYSYQWQSSDNETLWLDITTNATSTTYIPGVLNKTTYYRCCITDAVCGLVYTNSIKIAMRPTILAYPDIRIQVCPDASAGIINLSKYIDTLDLQTLTWSNVSAGSAQVSTNGGVDAANLTAAMTYIYEYTITNSCITSSSNQFYLTAIKGGVTKLPLDTVVICKDLADGLQLNQIMGIDAQGTWRYIPSNSSIDQHIKQSPSSSPYYGAVIFDGKTAYDMLPNEVYRGVAAKKIEFYYKSHINSCLSNKEYKLVLIITPNILP